MADWNWWVLEREEKMGLRSEGGGGEVEEGREERRVEIADEVSLDLR